MAKQLLSASLTAPGFKGLNTEDSYTLDPEFALEAENCVIDQRGRLVSRKGWVLRSANELPLSGVSFFEDVLGVRKILSWYDDGTATQFYEGIDLEAIQPDGGNPSSGDWTGVTLNDNHFFFAKGQTPLVYNNTEFKPIPAHGTGHPVPKAGIALAAYGRLWVADTDENSNVVYFSSLLNGTDFGNATVDDANATGRVANNVSSAGLFNISALFTDGTDRITGLGAINGYLAIFCEDSIVLLGDNNPNNDSLTLNPLTMFVVEVIKGVGCIAPKSIQNIGSDILFLSKSGVQSLGRTIQEKSQPLVSASQNVKTDLTNDLEDEDDLSKISAIYSEKDTFYILQLVDKEQAYVFDTRTYLDSGALRVTKWTGNAGAQFVLAPDKDDPNAPTNLYRTTDRGLAEYTGFTDLGAPIPIVYHSPFLDYGLPNKLKYIKKIGTVFTGGNNQELQVTAAGDFDEVAISPSNVFNVQLGQVSLFKTPEATFDPTGAGGKYGIGVGTARTVVSSGGAAELIQLRCVSSTKQGAVSIQRFDLYFKEGKLV